LDIALSADVDDMQSPPTACKAAASATTGNTKMTAIIPVEASKRMSGLTQPAE